MAGSRPLRRGDLDPDPIRQFRSWFQAAGAAGIAAPEAAAVATADGNGRPSCRMVLVKAFEERGFVFFTNYASDKGRALAANPEAALLFHWAELERQVRIEGSTQPTSRAQSVTYAHSRTRASQLSALASAQSRPVADRATLQRRVDELDRAHPDGPLPVGQSWGGVRVIPRRIEFWQGGPARLHDRFVYELLAGGGWSITRLAP